MGFRVFEFLKSFIATHSLLSCKLCGVTSDKETIILAATPRTDVDKDLCYKNAICEYCLFGIKVGKK